MANVLIIDDDRSMCAVLSRLVQRTGHEATCKNTLQEGLEAVLAQPYDAVFLDVNMPDGSGLDILNDIRRTESMPEVIIMTGFGDPDGAEIAIKNGAWDYIQKSDSPSKIILPLQRVLQYRESLKSRTQPTRALKLNDIIGSSAAMQACYNWIAQVAGSDGNVLLTGETGTGKELFARAIHENSGRCAGNFVVVDCAALPETLVEGILFGHVKGAYTGAIQHGDGLVSQADGGTLFLDEIGELPLNVQKVFLRVLQERRYRPVGGKKEFHSDFRLVAATNCDLEKMTQAGAFRKDLLFRLRALSLTLPPLRRRADDIKALVNHYIVKICERQKMGNKGTSPDFLDMLTRYPWPGNVRELINTLETAISAAGGDDMLFSRHLPDYVRINVARGSLEDKLDKPAEVPPVDSGTSASNRLPSFKAFRKTAVVQAEKAYFERLKNLSRGDVRTACRISKLSRSRYYELLKFHEINSGQNASGWVQ